jgi:hypothetical protein
MKQQSFDVTGFEKYRKKLFLEEMEKIIPWQEIDLSPKLIPQLG